MSDTHTVTTTQSWGSRLGGSFKGILFGIIMFLGSFVLLWWNEGSTQEQRLALLEGAAMVVAAPNAEIDKDKEGKLIHTTGLIKTEESLQDGEFGIAMPEALQLRRQVEMYQWQESSSSKSEKNLGGSETTTKTYSYAKGWSSSLAKSSNFQKPEGHQNPETMEYENQTWVADQARMGALRIRPEEVKGLSNFQPIDLEGFLFNKILRSYQVMGDHIYVGDNPQEPQVGDMRIRFSFVPATQASIIAQQQGDVLVPYQTKVGKALLLLQSGDHSAQAMFASAQSANDTMAWIMRLVGFMLMFAGLRTILAPLSVLGDVVPFIGDLIGVGTGIIAFLIALPLTLITIAIAWVFYRPLLALGLGVVAVGSLGALWNLRRKKAGTMNPSTTSGTVQS